MEKIMQNHNFIHMHTLCVYIYISIYIYICKILYVFTLHLNHREDKTLGQFFKSSKQI